VKTEREMRVKDFQRRAAYAPSAVYKHRTCGWSYIPVHDFADESGGAHLFVDCWCHLGSDAALLECCGREQSSLEPGLYAKIDAESPFWTKLHAILLEPLTRAVVEATMQRFVELGFPEKLPSELCPGGSLVRLGS